jgi:hypothetical protein
MVLRRPRVRFVSKTPWDGVSDKAIAILFGRAFAGFLAIG